LLGFVMMSIILVYVCCVYGFLCVCSVWCMCGCVCVQCDVCVVVCVCVFIDRDIRMWVYVCVFLIFCVTKSSLLSFYYYIYYFVHTHTRTHTHTQTQVSPTTSSLKLPVHLPFFITIPLCWRIITAQWRFWYCNNLVVIYSSTCFVYYYVCYYDCCLLFLCMCVYVVCCVGKWCEGVCCVVCVCVCVCVCEFVCCDILFLLFSLFSVCVCVCVWFDYYLFLLWLLLSRINILISIFQNNTTKLTVLHISHTHFTHAHTHARTDLSLVPNSNSYANVLSPTLWPRICHNMTITLRSSGNELHNWENVHFRSI